MQNSLSTGHILSAEVWDRRKLVLIARPPIEGAPFLFTIELSEKASVLLNDIRYPMQLIDADHKVISSALFPDDFIRSPPASILLDRFPPAWSALQAAASPSSRLIFPITEHHTVPPLFLYCTLLTAAFLLASACRRNSLWLLLANVARISSRKLSS